MGALTPINRDAKGPEDDQKAEAVYVQYSAYNVSRTHHEHERVLPHFMRHDKAYCACASSKWLRSSYYVWCNT